MADRPPMSRARADEILARLGGTTSFDGMLEVHEALLVVQGVTDPETRIAILARIRAHYEEPPAELSAEIADELRQEIATHEAWIGRRERLPGSPDHVEAIIAEQRRHVAALRELLALEEA